MPEEGKEEALADDIVKGASEEDSKQDDSSKVKVWSLVPVQDAKSDQSNTAPKKLIIPTDSYGGRLGRNPYTGVMDALVSRELLEVTMEPPSAKFPNGRPRFRALRCPNKINLNLETCFKDDMNRWTADVGDVISLYGPKYRYVVAFGFEENTPTATPNISIHSAGGPPSGNSNSQTNGPSATPNSERATMVVPSPTPARKSMFNSPFGVKVAPSPGADDRSRRISSRKSSLKKATEKIQSNNTGVSALHWGFFVVVSGCMIALVYIFARNTNEQGEESTGNDHIRKLLRGSLKL